MSSKPNSESNTSDPKVQLQEYIDLAQRAYALQKFEEAVENYASALEVFTAEHGQDSPESADLLFKYGKALLENAIAQATVLGKEPPAEEAQDTETGGDKIHFSGDAEDEDEEDEEDEEMGEVIMEGQQAVQLGDVGKTDEDEEDEEMADAEPEDDFNAAWEVLDLARALYEKGDGDDMKFKLAETYIALGDVSLETEKFDQAMSDYTSALELKTTLLPLSSRQIAEVHYKLSIVSDLSLGRLADAITHAEKASSSLEARLNLLKTALESTDTSREVPTSNGKGKGKESFGAQEQAKISAMPKDAINAEIKEIEDLRDELLLKIEELKTTPQIRESAPEAANRALDEVLGRAPADPKTLLVNDLTSMVKKKKPAQQPQAANGAS